MQYASRLKEIEVPEQVRMIRIVEASMMTHHTTSTAQYIERLGQSLKYCHNILHSTQVFEPGILSTLPLPSLDAVLLGAQVVALAAGFSSSSFYARWFGTHPCQAHCGLVRISQVGIRCNQFKQIQSQQFDCREPASRDSDRLPFGS